MPSSKVKTLSSRIFQADFDENSGAWLHLKTRQAQPLTILGAGLGFDIYVDGKRPWGQQPRLCSGFRYFAEGRGGAFLYECGGLLLTHSIEMDAALPLIYQSVLIKATAGPPCLLEAVEYILPDFAIGSPGECSLRLPGDVERPYLEADVAASQVGAITVSNQVRGCHASCWLAGSRETAVPALLRQGELLTVTQPHRLQRTLQPGKTAISQGFNLLLTEGSADQHLAEFQRLAG